MSWLTRAARPGRRSRLTKKTVAARMPDANANHLICWRSSAFVRRKRTTTEADATRKATGKRLYPASNHSAPRIPKGFCTRGKLTRGPGTKADEATPSVIATNENANVGRHRGEGSRPSGNNRGRMVPTGPTKVKKLQLSNHPATRPPGREPGDVIRE